MLAVLLFFTICGNAQEANKKVNINLPAQSLEATLKLLEEKAGIIFTYESSQLKSNMVKAHSYNNANMSEILTDILEGTGLGFAENSNTIIIKKNDIVRKGKTLSGYVEDASNSERLIGVSLYIKGQSEGTSTNNFGFYSITLPDDKVSLSISYLGYKTIDTTINLRENTKVTFKLNQVDNTIKDVVITSSKQPDLVHSSQMSTIDLSIQNIKSLPAFLGEVDIMKAIQLLPGIQAGSEGSTGLYVRGGGADENLILLDGVPVYNASHLFGFMSVFNADAVKNVSVIKGGFPARYGGRLSSVIDINMKEGDKNNYHGEGGIGLIASRLTLEGPIQKGKSSFVVSGRRTYADIFTGLFSSGDNKIGYYFYDLNGKVNFTLGSKDHVYVSGYFGNDKFYTKPKGSAKNNPSTYNTSLLWGNITAVARWNHEFGPKLFGNLTAYYSQYRFNLSNGTKTTENNETNEFLTKLSSGIKDKAVKYDIEFFPNPMHNIKIGVGAIAHRYEPSAQRTKITSAISPEDTTIGDKPINAGEYDAYIEDDIKISDKLKANIGLHYTAFNVSSQVYHSLQPRLSARYLVNNDFSIKASYAQMNQFVHLLTNSSVGLPTDLWVPVTDRIPAELAHQVAAGVAYTNKTGIEVSVEGYYKALNNVLEYKDGAGFASNTTNWQDKVVVGKGNSYGMELFIQKKQGRLTGMLGYTLSWTNRTFDELNNGKTFPYHYDRRHDFKVAAVYSLTPKIEVSAEWVYGTGNAITIPVAAYTGPDNDKISVYGSRNDYRMQAYHRGDISIKFMKKKKLYERAWIFSVYNVYNRHNPFYIYDEGSTFKQTSIFPILPSITYQFKF
jgi:outer membrane cobalamin receptor